ncbi:hypothetical protein N9Y89_02170 [bacterium]|nr:hypothetical protein [bacterium]
MLFGKGMKKFTHPLVKVIISGGGRCSIQLRRIYLDRWCNLHRE